MSPEASRYRRRIGRALITGRLPFDYDPARQSDMRCSVCRINNPGGCAEQCPCHCHARDAVPRPGTERRR